MKPSVVFSHDRYMAALREIPPSGGGGCHTALLRVANFGRQAGRDANQIACDLAKHVHGTRTVSGAEISAAVAKAFDSMSTLMPHANARDPIRRPIVDEVKLLKGIVERGAAYTEVDLWEASPERINWPPRRDAIEMLRRLYASNDRLFIGTRYDTGGANVLAVSEWIERFERSGLIPEHVIPNPLTGKEGLTKVGKASFRADSCVARFRVAVVEFDTMPREQQIKFWAGVKLPVLALLDSGGKSVHGWIRIDAVNADEWSRRVESKLFEILTALGADGACKNEARLSRMPGHFRVEKNRWQRLLYLDPVGGPIIP